MPTVFGTGNDRHVGDGVNHDQEDRRAAHAVERGHAIGRDFDGCGAGPLAFDDERGFALSIIGPFGFARAALESYISISRSKRRSPEMLFYKSGSRSTVLDRIEAQRSSSQDAGEEMVVDAQVAPVADPLSGSLKPAPAQNPRLSAFEKELLQAWAQD
jgi:hypothetical protein